MLNITTKPDEKKYFVERFNKEAEILHDLKHVSLPSVKNYFIENDRYYLVMDYIEGEDLETVMNSYGGNGVPENLVIEWAKEILDTLEYLHNQSPPIIYRDMKPPNIMLKNSDKKIILIDFGIARTLNPKSQTVKTVIGTPAFSPKEIFSGRPEPRSDIYSLGGTIHCLLTGIVPVTPFSFQPVREHKPEVSESLEAIVMKSLESRVEDRFSSASEMRAAIDNLSSYSPVAIDSRVCSSAGPPEVSSSALTVPPEVSSSANTVPPEVSSSANTVPPEVSSSANTVPPEVSSSANTVPPEVSSSANTVPPQVSSSANTIPSYSQEVPQIRLAKTVPSANVPTVSKTVPSRKKGQSSPIVTPEIRVRNKGWRKLIIPCIIGGIVFLLLIVLYKDNTGNNRFRNNIEKLGKAGKYDEAIELIDKNLEVEDDDVFCWEKKGLFLYKKENYEEAQKCMDSTIEIEPSKTAWNIKGLIFFKKENYEEALKCMESSIKIEPSKTAWNTKGRIFQEEEKYEKAVNCYEEALKIDKNDGIIWANKAYSLCELGRNEEAYDSFAMALECDLDDGDKEEVTRKMEKVSEKIEK